MCLKCKMPGVAKDTQNRLNGKADLRTGSKGS